MVEVIKRTQVNLVNDEEPDMKSTSARHKVKRDINVMAQTT